MKTFPTCFVLATLMTFLARAAEPPPAPGANVRSMFDGQTLTQWEGNPKLWRVQDGCLTGGSLTETVARNDFLATTRDYTNFIVRLKIKLTGTNGFINSGFQIRSQRVPNNSEMAGYQCDFGDPNWWGAIYDESRRNKVMSPSDMKALGPVIKRQDWNDYVIRADGPRVTTWINGAQGTDYTEADPAIPDWGKLGIQVHGGGKALVQVKDITIEELPPTPPGKRFLGAPEPKKSAKASPLSPKEERASFTLPPGFEIELVASEDVDAAIGKFVTVDWDLQGRLWSMTALEYPVDANESPAVAKELYASRAKDKVVVYDRDPKSPTGYASKPRVFADGLAIPLGILPYKAGAYVQHGTEIVFLSDTDGDGKADKREVMLSGFGVQDSHLFPHQFTRAPGNWIWFAQGAFNYGKVKTTRGAEVKFDQTRMAKFRYDGSDFDITSQGPCNIWGLVLTAEGEAWIQEANDYGYPVMPFHEYANYPGCSDSQFKSYAPEFPGTAPDFKMGGTGLSGLALTDKASNDERKSGSTLSLDIRHSSFRSWPPAYCDVMYVANPITRKIQAIKITRDGPRFRYQKLPDFVQSSDEMFRPVALRLGPDGCLYIVDWYNKIISHNEVPRAHPERDKKRGRIWRVKHNEQKPFDVPDFTKLRGDELIAKLGGASTPQSHLAWQAITDRQIKELTPKLNTVIADKSLSAGKRIAALWALEGLQAADASTVMPLFTDANRNVRREAVRAAGEMMLPPGDVFYSSPVLRDPEPEVRAEVIRATGRFLMATKGSEQPGLQRAYNAVRVLINGDDLAPLPEPTMKSTQSGKTIKSGVAYDREFERYLVRFFLESQPKLVADFLHFDSQGRSVENTVLAILALDPKESSAQLAQALPRLNRAPDQEELLRLAQFPNEPGVGEALKKILQQPATSIAAIESLLKVRTKLDAVRITPLLNDAAKQLLTQNNAASLELGAKLAGSFHLDAVEPELVRVLLQGWGGYPNFEAKEYLLRPESLAALRALRELKSDRVDLFAKLAEKGGAAEQQAALAALAASRDERGPQQLASIYQNLPAASRRSALASLTTTRPGAQATIKAIQAGTIPKDELDGATLDKLQVLLGNDRELAALMQDMASFLRPALRLNGSEDAWVDSDITLDGPFTVETWVKLDAGIDNNDGILGAPGVLDMNFYGGQFRVWVGTGGIHDAIVSKKKIAPDLWTHITVTRDADGKFRLYQNGELDSDESKPVKQKFEHLRIGWTAPSKGTAGWLNDYRVWNRARTAEEILADFDRSFDGETKPAALVSYFPGGDWKKLKPGAKVQKTSEFPPLLTAAEARTLAEKLSKFRALAEAKGDAAHGKQLFVTSCLVCHQAGGQGAAFAPNLDGLGLRTTDGLLRAILTPSAAMEAGYRAFRVETKDGEIYDGFLVSQDASAVVLRQPNAEPMKISAAQIKRAAFRNVSIMPDGLLEGMEPQQVKDLFAYLKSMK
ncbi:MAG TPA: PVC-type heme-binding CxxCH protein [Candidatus Limnocylindria bacterium]|nr:PVC-type heme-binding CxxCH protein [Candidatus Limnocylindria bacterium]